ncbi:UDP-galactopyranose mutase [Nocardiopsis trehalosi]|jgi:UDP-galactopyranose mutase|uniref:UDP-galactopyranose mutase n=1 Tax=Nocardiopsis trehalosi TaxID=109329 RepID=UPI000834703C|nr:UDP-galactopyranose mutase [Nocardiopsis trehalosi]
MTGAPTGPPSVAVIGAGWAGATAARLLHDAGCGVHVYEAARVAGGHSRSEVLNGVVYEPEGPHIFHTSDQRVRDFAVRHGMGRPYAHCGLTHVFLDDDDEHGRTLSWPPQVDELRGLPLWPAIERELAALPEHPSTRDFASYCVGVMGPTLYRLFIEGYTVKQWGRRPEELSARFAPGRLGLRTDGVRRLFRDTWEFFPAEGAQGVIESVLRPVPGTFGEEVTADRFPDLEEVHDAVVITAPLDAFLRRPGELEWRGIRTVSRYVPVDGPEETATAGYIVNQPSLRVPYTRTVETKHATGQRIAGTVVAEEYPGADARHYPVLTPDERNERGNARLQREIREATRMRVFFCGRLANYDYINQDVAIAQGMACADEVLAALRTGPRV